jgi:hypothetical protein
MVTPCSLMVCAFWSVLQKLTTKVLDVLRTKEIGPVEMADDDVVVGRERGSLPSNIGPAQLRTQSVIQLPGERALLVRKRNRKPHIVERRFLSQYNSVR